MSTYKMTIAGVERELEMFEVNEHLDIAAFILFNDVEITERVLRHCLKSAPSTMLCLLLKLKAFLLLMSLHVSAAEGLL
ncbi:MAG: hypothetical protein Q4B92_03355 [Ruminococcus sp.]|nr:hypothetical protein [Ruminococcus sp.]